MAWRIADAVVRGEIDNRIKHKITGKLWFAGIDKPYLLDLQGNCAKDLAGCLLTFTNPNACEENIDSFAELQNGICGQMTASRKVKIPTIPMQDMGEGNKKKPVRYCWANILYLEWYSQFNGRVMIEAVDYTYDITLPSWQFTPEDEAAQQRLNESAMDAYLAEFEAMMQDEQTENINDPAAQNDAKSTPAAESEEDNVDPNEEERIERVLRINDLKHEAEELAGGPLIYQDSAKVPPEVEEQFWQHVVDIEKAETVTRRELLKMDDFEPHAPAEIDDQRIEAFLWELIDALAARSHYFEQTDHLSDRELYALIFDRILDEPTQILPKDTAWCFHIIVSEYGSLDGELSGVEIYLRYYADEAWRQRWAADFPDEALPEQQPRPFKRDHRLPKREGHFDDNAPGDAFDEPSD